MLQEPRYPFSTKLPVVEAVEAGQQHFDPDIWGFDYVGTGGTLLLVNPLKRVASWTDEQLEPARWTPLPESLTIDPSVEPWERPRWAFDGDLTTVAEFEVDEMSIHDASGIRFRRAYPPGWDPDSRRPRLGGVFIDQFLWCVVTETPPDRHRLMVIDCERWEEVASAVLESQSPEGFLVWAHPSGNGVVIDAGRGQDGTDLWTARRDGDGLAIRRLGRDDQAFSGAFFDDGSLLLLPHTGDTLGIYSWPDLVELAHLSNSDVFAVALTEGGDEFSWCGFPVEDRYLLLMTVQGRLVLVDHRQWELIAEIRIPGYGWLSSSSPAGQHFDPDLFAVRKVGGRRFLADHEREPVNTIWAIPRLGP